MEYYQMKSGAERRTTLFVPESGLSDRVDFRLMETPEEKDSIYLLRYKAYLHGGVTAPCETERVCDHYDDAPNAYITAVYVDGELCSSIRLNVVTPDCRISGSADLFGDILHPRLDRGEVFIDPLRFAALPEKARQFPELAYLTVRLGYMACEHFNADTGLAVVRAEHQAFYRRVFLHETIAEPRSFPNVLKKVALMASGFRSLREQVLNRFPIMRSSAFERRMLFERPGGRRIYPAQVVTPIERPSIVPSN
jgi:hypothetical protein